MVGLLAVPALGHPGAAALLVPARPATLPLLLLGSSAPFVCLALVALFPAAFALGVGIVAQPIIGAITAVVDTAVFDYVVGLSV